MTPDALTLAALAVYAATDIVWQGRRQRYLETRLTALENGARLTDLRDTP